jgi:hypothetical protein
MLTSMAMIVRSCRLLTRISIPIWQLVVGRGRLWREKWQLWLHGYEETA